MIDSLLLEFNSFCHLPKDATGRVEQAVAVPGSHPACCSPPKAGNWKLNVIAVWPKEKSWGGLG